MRNSHTLMRIRSSFIACAAVLGLCGIAVVGLFGTRLTLMLRILWAHHELQLVLVGLTLLGIAIVAQWHRIRSPHTSIGKNERSVTGAITTLALILGIQFVATVYAMSLTLLSTSSEVKDTWDILIADFDTDGDLDYIAGNRDSTDTFHLDKYLNNGSASFSQSTFGLSTAFRNALGGDIDGDGDVDFVSNNFDALYTYSNNGSSTFTRSTIATGLSTGFHTVITGDFNSDGYIDFIGGNLFGSVTNALYLNNGHGTFTVAASSLPALTSMCAADFDSDGDLDLAISNNSTTTLKVFKNSGTGAFVELSSLTHSLMAAGVGCGDLDNDGDIDVAGSDLVNFVPYRNNGAGTLTAGTTTAVNISGASDVDLADLDNDGDLDVILSSAASTGNGGGEIFLNNGSAVFTSQGTPPNILDNTNASAIGDLDGDSDLDYIRGNSDSGGLGNGQANRIFSNDQAGTSTNTAPTAPNVSTLTAALLSVNNGIFTADATGDVGSYSAIRLTASGTPLIAYYDNTNGDLKFAQCANRTCSSGTTKSTLDSAGNVGQYVSMALPSDGKPIIAYYDTTNGDLKTIKCGNAACSLGNTTTTVDSSGNVGQYTSVAVPSDGLPIVSYYDVTNSHLKAVKCGNATCSSGNSVTTADNTSGVGVYTSIAIGNDDLAVIAYQDDGNGDLKVTKCGNAACSSGNTTTTVDSTGFVGDYGSIAIPSDGKPVISYLSGFGNIKVAKCGNASCSSGNTTTNVDIVDPNKTQTSIGVLSNDKPVVAYYDDGGSLLRIATCGNTACSSGNVVTDISSENSVSISLSMVVATGDRPVVSYYNAGGSFLDLKVLTCGNSTCSASGTDGAMNFVLSWGSGSDSQTATRLLQYQLKVGTGSSAENIISGRTSSSNWVNFVMPNGQSRRHIIKNLPCGSTVYWSVAPVDTGYKSTWSSEQSFTLNSVCGFGTGGGGGGGGTSGGGGTTGGTGGGGGAAWLSLVRTDTVNKVTDGTSAPAYGFLTIKAFKDLNGDGTQDDREVASFKGLPVTIVGSTLEGKALRQIVYLGENGSAKIRIRESDSQGYSIIFGTGSSIVEDYIATGKDVQKIVVKDGTDATVETGFQQHDLLRLLPCMQIGTGEGKEIDGIPALTLLQRLKDIYGQTVTRGVNLDTPLMTRRDFLTLILRTHCVDLVPQAKVQEKLRTAFAAGTIPWWTSIELRDVRLNPYDADAALVYSLLANGIPAVRESAKGGIADLNSPVSRREAMLLTEAAMKIPAVRQEASGATLPIDLSKDDPLVKDFLVLQNFGVLPESFLPVLGADLGLDTAEAPTLLMRAAFRAGRIDLLPALKKDEEEQKKTFISVLPPYKMPSCLETDADRPGKIVYTDVLPGSALYDTIRPLLAYGTRGGDKQMLWLLSGTPRLSEYGVEKAETTLKPSEDISVLDMLRSLLILSCLPQDSRATLVSTAAKGSPIGSGESRIPRDRISDLPRDETLASRILYRSQDRIKEFDLSLFSFAPNLLKGDFRSPTSPMSVREASELLSSALLSILVKNHVLTYVEAEGKMQELSYAMLEEFLGTDVTDRDTTLGDKTVFTRLQFIHFLSEAVKGVEQEATTDLTSDENGVIQIDAGVSLKSAAPAEPDKRTWKPLPLGQIWWERVK